jgi:hypothetical protein
MCYCISFRRFSVSLGLFGHVITWTSKVKLKKLAIALPKLISQFLTQSSVRDNTFTATGTSVTYFELLKRIFSSSSLHYFVMWRIEWNRYVTHWSFGDTLWTNRPNTGSLLNKQPGHFSSQSLLSTSSQHSEYVWLLTFSFNFLLNQNSDILCVCVW